MGIGFTVFNDRYRFSTSGSTYSSCIIMAPSETFLSIVGRADYNWHQLCCPATWPRVKHIHRDIRISSLQFFAPINQKARGQELLPSVMDILLCYFRHKCTSRPNKVIT